MQVLVSVIDDGQAEAAGATESATTAEMAAVDAFNERLRAAGQLVYAQGVSAPEDSAVIDARGGEPVVTSGLVGGGDEYMAGFWIWDVADLDTARDLAADASRACNRKIELRAILGEGE
jgi:hypothetical protein